MGFQKDIEQGKAKLTRRREVLLREITAIDAELKDYDTALRVAQKLASPVNDGGEAQVPSSGILALVAAQEMLQFTGSIRDLTLEILKSNYPNGMTAGNIRTFAKMRYDVDLNPNTLTVSLGRLKTNGDVRIVGRIWFYTPKKDAPPDESGGASDSEGSA